MKATRKLIPAIALLLVSAVLLSTASYAWFTTNKTVKADMTVSVTAPQNLQISLDATTWKNYYSLGTTPALTPVSSADGRTFVLCSELKLEQDGVFTNTTLAPILAAQATTENTEDDIGKVETVTTGTGYYYQKDFQLRATQAFEDLLSLVVTIDSGDKEGYSTAARVIIFTSKTAAGLNTADATVVYKSTATSAAEYPIVEGTGEGAAYIVSDEAWTASNTVNTLDFAAAEINYFRVVVWIEGNDSACVSANVDDQPAFDINLEFTLAEPTP